MKIINFGEVVKRLRYLEGITQSEFVEMVDAATKGESGIDSVSISRWENNVIAPCHKRQIELVRSVGYELHELIKVTDLLVEQEVLGEYLMNKLIVNNYWDFSSIPCNFDNLIKKEVISEDSVNFLFVDKNTQVPSAHISFHIEEGTLTKNQRYMVIDTIYCNSPMLLLELIKFMMLSLINREVDGVIYKSKHKSTPLSKFFKSIGFKVIDKRDNKYINILTHSDVLYNQIYFNLACCYVNRIVV